MDQSLNVRIGRYLSGEMTEQEKTELEQQAAGSPVLAQSLAQYKRIWEATPESVESVEWDTESAWHRFNTQATGQPVRTSRLSPRLIWAAAATVLVLFGTYWFFQRSSGLVHYAYDPTTSDPIVLSDGTNIFLNQGAEMVIHRFSRHLRAVKLVGEAYFEVAPDSRRPFRVLAGGTVTEVVGTSFNIRQMEGHTSLMVNSGKVIFSSEKDQKKAVALTAGESAVFENERIRLIPNPSPNILSWRTQQLIFKNMPLEDVLRDVALYFGQEVNIENPDIRACRISIARPFVQPDIQSLLKAIALTINATLVQEGDTYVIRGGGCS